MLIIEDLVSDAVLVLAFGAVFELLPDAIIECSDSLVGASLTAILFIAVKFLIGLYIDHSRIGGACGPGGACGKPIRPNEHAIETVVSRAGKQEWAQGQPERRDDA